MEVIPSIQSPSTMIDLSTQEALENVQNSVKIENNLKYQVITKLDVFIKHNLSSHLNSCPEGPSYSLAILTKSLQDLQAHLRIIAALLTATTKEEITIVYQNNEVISSMYTKITEASLISLVPLNDALDTIFKVTFEELKQINCDLKNHKNSAKMQIAAYKLGIITEYLPALVQIATEDIFAQPRSALIWEKLGQITEKRTFKDKNAVLHSIEKIGFKFNIANAILYKSEQSKYGAISGLSSIGNQKKAQTLSCLYLSNPTMESAFKLWSLADKNYIKEINKLRIPSIEYDKKIYIPRLFPHITRASVLKEYEDGSLQKIKEKSVIVPAELSENKKSVLKNIFHSDHERIKIRILSSKPLVIQGHKREKIDEKLYEFKQKFKSKKSKEAKKSHSKIDGVIIQIHGGGFVSMSSSLHRNYLIRWAKELNVVIFAIDYRLAPEHPFPAGLEDVWQAYNWLVNYSESILGIPMNNIVLTGDSAGGNLAASLTLRAIREGIRVPDGLLLSYPTLNLFPHLFVPSYFQAINDVILPANLLKLCLKAYIPEEFRPESDPFLSPVRASDELLAKLPPVRMISGTSDPLHDDIWTFAERLLRLEKDVKVTLFDGLPHGFLSLDEMLEYDTVVSEAAQIIAELFKLKK